MPKGIKELVNKLVDELYDDQFTDEEHIFECPNCKNAVINQGPISVGKFINCNHCNYKIMFMRMENKHLWIQCYDK